MINNDNDRALGLVFGQAAEFYDRARPDYPEQLFDDLVSLTGMKAGDRALEVGCATGKATLPVVRRGLRVTCVEPSPISAAVARTRLADFEVEIIEGQRFEDWRPQEQHQFDLVFAATAWHWIDPAVGYRRAWEALRDGGHLSFWMLHHVYPDDGDPFVRELEAVYNEMGENMAGGSPWPRPGELKDSIAAIEASELFDVEHVRQYDWEWTFNAETLVELLNTYSGPITMETRKRERLYTEIRRRLALRPDGLVRRHFGSVLHVARRRS